MEGDIHTVLDSLTLAFTLWVIYMIRFKLRASYMAELDTTPWYYVVRTCFIVLFSYCFAWSVQQMLDHCLGTDKLKSCSFTDVIKI